MNNILISLFKYKAWANTELHAALADFDAQRHPDVFQTMLQILDHSNVVDQLFQSRLMDSTTQHFKATNSAQTPSLPELSAAVKMTDDWYLQFVSDSSAEQLKQRRQFNFIDGDRGAMSCEEMLLHVITHAGYHRGSVGQILEGLGLNSPPDSLTKFLHRHEPERRH